MSSELGEAIAVVFGFTTFLAIAGVGSAFIVVPAFFWLGVTLPAAMASGLLLNTVSMAFASINNAKNRFISYKSAVPIGVSASILSPAGVYSSKYFSQNLLLWFFSGFLVFAALFMLLYRPRKSENKRIKGGKEEIVIGISIGALAGFVGGLLGVGGGNLIIPVLVWLGFSPKDASGTTALVVVFSSLSGFLSRAQLGGLDYHFLAFAVAASVAGGLLGSWLMKKLNNRQVKTIIGFILLIVAGKIVLGLV